MKTSSTNHLGAPRSSTALPATEHKKGQTATAAAASNRTSPVSPLSEIGRGKEAETAGFPASRREANATVKTAAPATAHTNHASNSAMAANLSGAGRVRMAAAGFIESVVSLAKTTGAQAQTSGLKRFLGLGARTPTDHNGRIEKSARNLIRAAQIPEQPKPYILKTTNAWSGDVARSDTPPVSDGSIPYCITTAQAALMQAVKNVKRDDPDNFRSVAAFLDTDEGHRLARDMARLELEPAALKPTAIGQAVTSLAGTRRTTLRSETEGSARSFGGRRATPAPAKEKAGLGQASLDRCGPAAVLQLVAGHDAVDQLAPSWIEAQRLSTSLATAPLEFEISVSEVLASIKEARDADAKLTGDRLLDQAKAIAAISTASVRRDEMHRLIDAWDREPSMMQCAKKIPDKQFFALKALFLSATKPEEKQRQTIKGEQHQAEPQQVLRQRPAREPEAMIVAEVQRRALKSTDGAKSGPAPTTGNELGSKPAGTPTAVPAGAGEPARNNAQHLRLAVTTGEKAESYPAVTTATEELVKASLKKNGVRHPIVMSPQPAKESNSKLKGQLETLLSHPGISQALQTMTTVEYKEVEAAFKEVGMAPPVAERKLAPRLASTDVQVAAERLLINIEKIAASPTFFGTLEQNDFRYCFTAPLGDDMDAVLQHCTNEQLVRFSKALLQNGDALPLAVTKNIVRRLQREALPGAGAMAARPTKYGSSETDWEAYGSVAVNNLGRLASLEQFTSALEESLRRHKVEDLPNGRAASEEVMNTNAAAGKLIADYREGAGKLVSRLRQCVEDIPAFANELSPEALSSWTQVADILVDRDASFESAAFGIRDAARMHAPSLIRSLAAALEDYGYDKLSESERRACGRRVINVLGDMAELSVRTRRAAGGPARTKEISSALRTASLSDCATITAMLGSGLLRQIWSSASILVESGTCVQDSESLLSGLADALAELKGDGQFSAQQDNALLPTELQGYVVNAIGVALPTTYVSAEAIASANAVMGPGGDSDVEIRHGRLKDVQRSCNIIGDDIVKTQATAEDTLAEVDQRGAELVGSRNFSRLRKWFSQTIGNAGAAGVSYDARKAWAENGKNPIDFGTQIECCPPLRPSHLLDPYRIVKTGADAALLHSTFKTFRNDNSGYVGSASVAARVTADANGCRLTAIVHGEADAVGAGDLATKTPEFLNREKRIALSQALSIVVGDEKPVIQEDPTPEVVAPVSTEQLSQAVQEVMTATEIEAAQAAATELVIADLRSIGLPESLRAFVGAADTTQLNASEAAVIANKLPTESTQEKLAYTLLPRASKWFVPDQAKMDWVALNDLHVSEEEVNKSFTDGFMRMDELGKALQDTGLVSGSGTFGPVLDLAIREDGEPNRDSSAALRKRVFAKTAERPMALAIKIRDHFVSMVVRDGDEPGTYVIVVADTDSRRDDPNVHLRRIDAIRSALDIGALNIDKVDFQVVSRGLQQPEAMANACGPLSLLLLAGFMAKSGRSPNGERFESYALSKMDALLALPLHRRARVVAALRAHSAAGRLMDEAQVNSSRGGNTAAPPATGDVPLQVAGDATPQIAGSANLRAANRVPSKSARDTLARLERTKLATQAEKVAPAIPSARHAKKQK